jgi:hypothetical protein
MTALAQIQHVNPTLLKAVKENTLALNTRKTNEAHLREFLMVSTLECSYARSYS